MKKVGVVRWREIDKAGQGRYHFGTREWQSRPKSVSLGEERLSKQLQVGIAGWREFDKAGLGRYRSRSVSLGEESLTKQVKIDLIGRREFDKVGQKSVSLGRESLTENAQVGIVGRREFDKTSQCLSHWAKTVWLRMSRSVSLGEESFTKQVKVGIAGRREFDKAGQRYRWAERVWKKRSTVSFGEESFTKQITVCVVERRGFDKAGQGKYRLIREVEKVDPGRYHLAKRVWKGRYRWATRVWENSSRLVLLVKRVCQSKSRSISLVEESLPKHVQVVIVGRSFQQSGTRSVSLGEVFNKAGHGWYRWVKFSTNQIRSVMLDGFKESDKLDHD